MRCIIPLGTRSTAGQIIQIEPPLQITQGAADYPPFQGQLLGRVQPALADVIVWVAGTGIGLQGTAREPLGAAKIGAGLLTVQLVFTATHRNQKIHTEAAGQQRHDGKHHQRQNQSRSPLAAIAVKRRGY